MVFITTSFVAMAVIMSIMAMSLIMVVITTLGPAVTMLLYPVVMLRMPGICIISLVVAITYHGLVMAATVLAILFSVPAVMCPWRRLVNYNLIPIVHVIIAVAGR